MTHDMVPDPGPQLDTAYVPGQSGAAWGEEEIKTTRWRILQVITLDRNIYNLYHIFFTGHSPTLGCYP